ncbi:MFS transporter [Alicyclobacillus sp. ALC3]|uniref:MFS transporter n=1 Tax=Alicyclobacillus sp. ALC3 TaxID=2796143 RepID=UPI002377E6BB|nr:MFS transporter [Alicyclobacillus sp. ALC3]WDL95822.1 MFS transporter [Alicyclobacillus sp. ALC3]
MTSPTVEIQSQTRFENPVDKRLFGLTWAHLLNDGAANYLPGILPAVLISLHEPLHMAGVLTASLIIGQALQPLMGFIADRIGGRSLVILGLCASTTGGALVGVANQLWVVIGLLLLIGVGSALFHPQALASVRSMVQSRHGLNTALFLVGGELGRGIWPSIASFIVVHLGLVSLWMIAIPGAITVPFLFRFAPKLPAKKSRGAAIEWSTHTRPLALLVTYSGIRAFATFGLATFIPILWHLHGGTLVGGASIITTMLVVGVIGNLGGGQLTDRIGRKPVLVLSAVATAIAIPVVSHTFGIWTWISAALLGIAIFLSTSTAVLIGQDTFPENRSMGSGVALGFSNGIGAVLVLVVGFWVTNSDVGIVFWVMAIASLLTAVLPFMFPKVLLEGTGSAHG